MEKYDECLEENCFFEGLLRLFPTLYDDAPQHQWVICIPRSGTTNRESCDEDDYKCHILQLLESSNESSLYTTLNSKAFVINGKVISPEKSSHDDIPVHVLFEEIFYNRDGLSFKVLCLDRPLQGNADELDVQMLHSLPQCVSFLNQHVSLRHIDELIMKFRRSHTAFLRRRTNLDMLKANAKKIYSQVLHVILRDRRLKNKVLLDKVLLDNLHLAVETYVLHGMHSWLIRDLIDLFATDDSTLNKKIRNLSELQPRDLDIPSKLCKAIPSARLEIARLGSYTTPLGQLYCLKRTFDCLRSVYAFTADDCLSVLTLLVIRSGIPNWFAHLNYMKNFCLSPDSDKDIGENGFHLANLEAAIEHINIGNIVVTNVSETLPLEDSISSSVEVTPLFPKDVDQPSTKAFFELVKSGCGSQVEELLKRPWNTQVPLVETLPPLCHPLCMCDRCNERQQKLLLSSKLSVELRDNRGRTALHVAVLNGRVNVIEILMRYDADVNATDLFGETPLHLACKRGLHSTVLLVLHFEANATIQDKEGNTPLHYAVDRGHERVCDENLVLISYDNLTHSYSFQCVKTLLYCEESMAFPLNVNAVNENGETPLHLASKWGYEDIVELLLQFGASIEIYNKSKQSPFDCAHSSFVLRRLKSSWSKIRALNLHKGKIVRSLSMSQLTSRNSATFSSDSSSELSSYEVIGHRGEMSQSTSPSLPHKVDKLFSAVAHNDLKLVSFYLGVASEELDEIEVQLPKSLCHPLCQCEKCEPVQKTVTTLFNRSSVHGVSVNCGDSEGLTPLHLSSSLGYLTMSQLLIRCGACVNARDCRGTAALHLACQNNRQQIAELLLKNDALINLTDVGGNTPLHLSSASGRLETSTMLIKNGANVNQPNTFGNTPLHEAARLSSSEQIVQLLLSHGASTDATNRKHATPCHLAKDIAVMKLLRNS